MIRRVLVWGVVALTLAAPELCSAQGDPPSPKPADKSAGEDVTAEYEELIAEFRSDMEMARRIGREKTHEDYLAARPKYEDYFPRFLDLAARGGEHKSAAKCLIWIIENRIRTPHRTAALEMIIAEHAEKRLIQRTFKHIVNDLSQLSAEVLAAIKDENEDELVRGRAHFVYAQNLLNKIEMTSFFRTLSKEDYEQQKTRFTPGAVEALEEMDHTAARLEAERALQTVLKSYNKITYTKAGRLGPQAKQLLFELQQLGIGKVAPEIAGEDIDGVPFKLSDYRGKVVVLDFWGDW